MKLIFVSALVVIFSLQSFAQEYVLHECVPRNENADISKVNVVYLPGQPIGQEFLEVYDKSGLILKVKVEYSDDMTYIAYANPDEEIYFDRDWPAENGVGSGTLLLGAWGDPKQRRYSLICESKNER